jgi:hypothetical protein
MFPIPVNARAAYPSVMRWWIIGLSALWVVSAANAQQALRQQIEDARALTLEQWRPYTQLVTAIEIGFKCDAVNETLANVAVQRIALMMDEHKANNGLINDRTLDVGAAIKKAIEDGRVSADCSRLLPADRARLRQTVAGLAQ